MHFNYKFNLISDHTLTNRCNYKNIGYYANSRNKRFNLQLHRHNNSTECASSHTDPDPAPQSANPFVGRIVGLLWNAAQHGIFIKYVSN